MDNTNLKFRRTDSGWHGKLGIGSLYVQKISVEVEVESSYYNMKLNYRK